jgi:DNA-binding CsgD family transcriptional regulator
MFTDVYVPMGVRENISFLVHPFGAGPRTSGWSFCRRVDFTDDELEVAGWCQPVLAALERLRRRPRPPRHAELTDAARRVGLTARELDIMSLVAEGLTAAAIGRLRRISPATVRKHLEHAYAKLGVSDRLVAVSRAREIGLIEPLGRRTEGETADAD